MNALTVQRPQVATTSPLMPMNMDQAMKLAEFMARAKMLPAHFHNSVGDALMVVEQAMRWGMSPFAVAQEASFIKGKMMFSGKIVAAAVETSGAIEGYFDYVFEGNGPTRAVVATATRRGDKEPRSVRVELKDARTDNQWWSKMPDQMLVYHAARVWARRWTPAVILGVYSPEELDGTTDDTPTPPPERIRLTSQPAPVQQLTAAEYLNDDIPALAPEPPKPDPLVSLRAKLAACVDYADVVRVADAWQRAVDKAKAAGRPFSDEVIDTATELLADRMGEVPAPAPATPSLDEELEGALG